MKVFHILSNPSIGGIEGMLSQVIPRVDPTRFEMQVVNMRTESRAYELWDQMGIDYHRLRTPGKLLLGSVIELVRLLRRERADIVEIYGLRANIIGRLAAKIAGVPVVLTSVLSTDDWRKWYHVWLDRITGWVVTGWIANSHACRQSLLERERHPADRVKVIYDGVDLAYWNRDSDRFVRLALRDEWGYDEDNIVFVTVANLRPDKGVQFLIEAIPRVLRAQEKARFLLVGWGSMGGEFQRRCARLGIGYAVTFAGFRRDIRDIYDAADVAVLPSLREGLPICLIEAMSMGLPVVATTVSGIPELVDDGVTGFLVPPRDVKALAEAIIQIGTERGCQKQMGQAGRQRVSSLFAIERMIEELQHYYQLQYKSAKGAD